MWHMLRTKSKFTTAFQLLIDCQTEVVYESALSSFTSHVHVKSYHNLHKKVMNKIAQNNANFKFELTLEICLKLLMLVMLSYLLVVLICFKS